MPREIATNDTQLLGYWSQSGAPPSPLYGTRARTAKRLWNSSGHYMWQELDNVDKQNIGGPFYLEQLNAWAEVAPLPKPITGTGPWASTSYRGLMQGYTWWDPNFIPAVDPSSFGPAAYAKMKPTKPSMNGLNSLFELKDLPGMLSQRLIKGGFKDIWNWGRNAANYFLAYKFGWDALFNDIVDMLQTQQKLEKRINWLLAHNGKPVRTRVDIAGDTTESDWVSNLIGVEPGFVTAYYQQERTLTGHLKETNKIWASAQFRFWLPDGVPELTKRGQLKALIYGIKLSPAVVWRAVPWTWLADWFFNVGTILQNMEAGIADRLAADYFYIMQEREQKYTGLGQCKLLAADGEVLTVKRQASYTRNTKVRLKGDPFGFGTAGGDLKPMQMAIIGALGMSKL